MPFSSTWLKGLLLLTLLLRRVVSEADDNTAPAAFVYPTHAGPDFVFALNAAHNGDLYFHMSGPVKNSWMAVGIGEEMDDALMFVVHKGANEGSITLSPRVAFDGTSEPTYYPAVRCEQLASPTAYRKRDGSSSGADSTMEANAVCHNATSWDGGSLDLSSTTQKWMFALGPDHALHSDSMSAPLLRHETYGNFDMDMTKATSTGSGAVPQPNGSNDPYVRTNASTAEDVTSDSDKAGIVHGVVMCVAYILLYPLGALLLRFVKRAPVRIHWICQSVASVLVVIGFGLGVYASTQYNRSRDYSDPHQIIGIVLLVAVVVQLALGSVHHLIFKKKKRSTVLGKIHLVVGPLIILLAIVNGGLGLELARK